MTSMPDANFLEMSKKYRCLSRLPTRGTAWHGQRYRLYRSRNGCARKMVEGYADKEIADQLGMSYYTVRFHINSLLSKTGCVSRTEVAIRVVRSGIIVPEL